MSTQVKGKYIVLIHKDEEYGYWGECPELPGCFSQGDTVEELMTHLKDAIELYFKDSPDVIINRVAEIRELAV